jgi:hypothetical protein
MQKLYPSSPRVTLRKAGAAAVENWRVEVRVPTLAEPGCPLLVTLFDHAGVPYSLAGFEARYTEGAL